MKLLIVLASLCVLAACERADDETPAAQASTARQTCEQFPQSDDDGTPTRPDVPLELTAFVEASTTTITIERESGSPACIDVAYGEVDVWHQFVGGRLIGVGITGHEFNSYLVVDRNSAAEPVETGVKPVFSPSGRRFASVDVSESGFGAFEALGVWEVTDTSIRNLVTREDLLDRGYDWQLVHWAADDCLVFSTAADPTGVDLEERKFHELRLTERPALEDVAEAAACRPA